MPHSGLVQPIWRNSSNRGLRARRIHPLLHSGTSENVDHAVVTFMAGILVKQAADLGHRHDTGEAIAKSCRILNREFIVYGNLIYPG